MGNLPDGRKFELCVSGFGRYAERVHVRVPNAKTTVCGREVRSALTGKAGAKLNCFACQKKLRDTERPPPAPRDFAPVQAVGSSRVHLCHANGLWLGSRKTLCGRAVTGVLALPGKSRADCRLCNARAKEAS